MALSEDELGQIETLLAAPDADAQAVAELRRRFPGLSFTRCDASDLGGEQPFREYQRFNLYLVDRVDHCWRITSDPTRATGVVVGRHKAGA